MMYKTDIFSCCSLLCDIVVNLFSLILRVETAYDQKLVMGWEGNYSGTISHYLKKLFLIPRSDSRLEWLSTYTFLCNTFFQNDHRQGILSPPSMTAYSWALIVNRFLFALWGSQPRKVGGCVMMDAWAHRGPVEKSVLQFCLSKAPSHFCFL